jgi:hypothetical protein
VRLDDLADEVEEVVGLLVEAERVEPVVSSTIVPGR